MDLLLFGLAIAGVAFAYLIKTPAGGAVPGCIGILLGLLIALGAIAKMIFF
jgi:hypothetical protein